MQISIISARIDELRRTIRNKRFMSDITQVNYVHYHCRHILIGDQTRASLEKMMALLEDYASLLQEIDNASHGSGRKPSTNYLMPSLSVSPDEWAEFENVYQVHCPTVYMSNAIRDVSPLHLAHFQVSFGTRS